jgi:hypothetical protein
VKGENEMKTKIKRYGAEKAIFLITLSIESGIHDYLDTMEEVLAVTTAVDQDPQVLLAEISARKAAMLLKIDPSAQIVSAPAGEYIDWDTDRVVNV